MAGWLKGSELCGCSGGAVVIRRMLTEAPRTQPTAPYMGKPSSHLTHIYTHSPLQDGGAAVRDWRRAGMRSSSGLPPRLQRVREQARRVGALPGQPAAVSGRLHLSARLPGVMLLLPPLLPPVCITP